MSLDFDILPEEQRFKEFVEQGDYSGALDLLSRVGDVRYRIIGRQIDLYQKAYYEVIGKYVGKFKNPKIS